MPGDTASAFVVAVDVVKFSERPLPEQRSVVSHLVTGVEASSVWRAAPAAGRYLNSTGDGFLLAIEARGSDTLPTDILALARDLAAMTGPFASPSVPFEVRVGVHFGPVDFPAGATNGRSFAVGDGLNWCVRVGDVAGPRQVAASEEFLDEHGRRCQIATRWAPARESDPFRVRVKHNRYASLRFLVDPALPTGPSPRLGEQARVVLHLERALGIVRDAFLATLTNPGESEAAARSRLNPRLTLWVRNADRLRPMGRRVQAQGTPATRFTPWPLVEGGRPAKNPLAAAWRGRTPRVLVGLPDPDAEERAYLAFWGRHGCPADKVGDFTRRPRALALLPLSLLTDETTGLLCVDFPDPLTGQEDKLHTALEALTEGSGYFLAALLR